MKAVVQTKTYKQMFKAALSVKDKELERSHMSIKRGMNKQTGVVIQQNIIQLHK